MSFISIVLSGGCSAGRAEHRPQLPEQEGPRGAAPQAQGLPAAEGEAGGGEGQETERGQEETLPDDGPAGEQKSAIQSEGCITRWIITRDGLFSLLWYGLDYMATQQMLWYGWLSLLLFCFVYKTSVDLFIKLYSSMLMKIPDSICPEGRLQFYKC